MRRMRTALAAEYVFAGLVGVVALALLGATLPFYLAWAVMIFGPLGLTLVVAPGEESGVSDGYVRLITPVAFAALMLGAYQFAHSLEPLIPLIGQDLDDFEQYIGEQYYAVISTLFAIITALILVKGIESFDRLNTVIGEEANQVRSTVEFLYYFEEQDHNPMKNIDETMRQTGKIRRYLCEYCDDALSDPSSASSDTAYRILRETTKVVGAIECEDDNDRMALAEVMRGLNLLFSIRARRVACSRTKIPVYMLVTLGLMSLAIILPFFIGSPALHPFNPAIIAILTVFCTFVLMLLRDINTPFEGFWRVDVRPFADLRRDLAQTTQPQRRATRRWIKA